MKRKKKKKKSCSPGIALVALGVGVVMVCIFPSRWMVTIMACVLVVAGLMLMKN